MTKLDAARSLLLVLLTVVAVGAFPQAPQERALSRAEALQALASSDAATRAEAVVWIANRGAMADAGLLHERLRDESGLVRSYAEQGLWLLWSRSGQIEIDRLMVAGVEHMQAERLPQAIAAFSEVTRRKPDFAEGWNKRATAHFLAGDYQASLADCAEVLKRNPEHFGAISGYGQIYFNLEQYDKALEWWRRALEVNPNMLGVEFNIKIAEERLKQKRGQKI